MDDELREIKTVLDSMNGCLYTISTNLTSSSNQPSAALVPTSNSYEPSVQTSVNNLQNTVSQMASALQGIQTSMWDLTHAVRTLAEIQCCLLAHMQGEVPEKKSLPWTPEFKNGWAEDMEPSEAKKDLEDSSF